MEYTIRKMTTSEYSLLNDFLYEAIFIPEGINPPPRNIIASPELQIYVNHFGLSNDDFALVAEVEKKIVGAVWVRIMNDYGHIDDETPSLAISIYKEYRGQGIGTVSRLAKFAKAKKLHEYLIASKDAFPSEESFQQEAAQMNETCEQIKQHLVDTNRVVKKGNIRNMSKNV